MTATVTEARDAIMATFRTAWLADPATLAYPVKWPDVAQGEFPPKTQDSDGNPLAWARIVINHNPGAGGQGNLSGDTGQRRYERFGNVIVSLFAPIGDGMAKADEMVRVAMQAFEGVRTAGTGIVFLRVRFAEIGPDGAYTQVNVLADFEYDEVR
jgi:hypothetical protein